MYPARSEGDRWRAVWYESDERQQCEAASEEKLAAKLEKVKVRLEADAPNMKKPGSALVAHYLGPDRLPVSSVRAVHRSGYRRDPCQDNQDQPHAAGRQDDDVGKLGQALAAGCTGTATS